MKLRKLRVQNFRAIKDLTLSFEDQLGRIRPITVLAGPNGCGKTSVLFAIVNALGGVTGYRTSDVPEPTDLDIHRTGSLGGALSHTRFELSVKLEIEFDEAERKAIPLVWAETRDLQNDLKPADIPNGRVTAEWKYPPPFDSEGIRRSVSYLNITPNKAFPLFHGRRNAIRGWSNKKLSKRALLDDIGGILLFPQDRNLQSRVVGNGGTLSGYQHREDVTDGLQFDEDDRRKTTERSVWEILEYLSAYSHQRQVKLRDEENWEKRIQEQFDRVCAPKKYLGFMFQPDDPVGAPYFQDGSSIYPLNMAASGEQVIIEYIARMTYRSPMNRSLILIDEPEVHLHPGWIRQLYRALPRIGTENQYILTTHSLELRAMAAEDNALVDLGEMEK